MIFTKQWMNLAGALAVLACSCLAASAAYADDDPWDAGSNWMYLRGGLARNAASGAGNGGAGYGIGFRHMLKPSKVNKWEVLGIKPLGFLRWTLFKDWSVGGFVEYDVLGRYGTAQEVEVPVALEMTRYLRWKSAARPYITLGSGPFYRKLYKTGQDFSRVKTSGFLATGFDAPVATHQMLGFDMRYARVASENIPVNPVFGPGEPKATHWSLKLSYAITY